MYEQPLRQVREEVAVLSDRKLLFVLAALRQAMGDAADPRVVAWFSESHAFVRREYDRREAAN
jgi:hypothetical protein